VKSVLLLGLNMEQLKIAYAAGFFDGEGHIRITQHSTRGSYMLQISAIQATPEPIEFLKELFGGTISKRFTIYKGGMKAVFTWQTSSKAAEITLLKMLPYLICKKDEAELALQFRKTFRPQYGERSKNSPELEQQRESMMYGLQKMRHDKRKVHENVAICNS
jgi:hypothetical protein